MDAKNYNVVFNLPLIISMERQRQLLGGDEDESRMNAQIEKFRAFNRFKIDVALDFSSVDENDCGISTDKVAAQNETPHYVIVVPLNCKFILIQHEQEVATAPLYMFGVGSNMILKTGAGTKITKETDPHDSEKCITDKETYSNLPLRIGLPYVRMSFCEDDDKDTVLVSQVDMDGVNEKKGPSKIYGYYGNEYHTEEDAEEGEYEAEEADIKIIMEEYVFQKSKTGQPLNIEEARRYQQAIERSEAIKLAKMSKEKQQRPYFTFNAKNDDPVIIDGEAIVIAEDEVYKEQTGHERKSTTHFKVKVVHEPLPYKKQ